MWDCFCVQIVLTSFRPQQGHCSCPVPGSRCVSIIKKMWEILTNREYSQGTATRKGKHHIFDLHIFVQLVYEFSAHFCKLPCVRKSQTQAYCITASCMRHQRSNCRCRTEIYFKNSQCVCLPEVNAVWWMLCFRIGGEEGENRGWKQRVSVEEHMFHACLAGSNGA